MREVKTTLVCSHCFKESAVRITYLGDSTIKITCESCGHITKVSPESISTFFSKDWKHRVLTKPLRIAQEVSHDPLHFVSTFPLRLLTKPLRIARELEKNLK